MEDFCLMTDSCCDLDAALAEELDLRVLPLSVHLGGETYRNWLDGREISFHDFYEKIRLGAMPTSSAVSVGDFENAMREALESGRDILCICFASALSATYQSASIAGRHMRTEFPERTIYVLDSLCASGGQGLLLYLCVQQKRAGKSLEEVRDYAMEMRDQVCGWFTVDDLHHLKRGGRLSAATALFGSMLSIKPILHVDEKGYLVNMDKARGRKAALNALVDHMEATGVSPDRQEVFLTHGDCLEDAEYVASEIRRRIGVERIRISYIGPVIGSHTGAGVVALFFLGSPK